jgi:hypothetical protein
MRVVAFDAENLTQHMLPHKDYLILSPLPSIIYFEISSYKTSR